MIDSVVFSLSKRTCVVFQWTRLPATHPAVGIEEEFLLGTRSRTVVQSEFGRQVRLHRRIVYVELNHIPVSNSIQDKNFYYIDSMVQEKKL